MNDQMEPRALLISVPAVEVRELERDGVATRVPLLRGPLIDAAIAVGVDGAALVTLLQTPDTVRKFADWILRRFHRSGESFELTARRGRQLVTLRVDGHVSPQAVARFVEDAFDEDE